MHLPQQQNPPLGQQSGNSGQSAVPAASAPQNDSGASRPAGVVSDTGRMPAAGPAGNVAASQTPAQNTSTDSVSESTVPVITFSENPAKAVISDPVIVAEEKPASPLPNFFHTEFDPSLSAKPRINLPDNWILPLLLTGFFFLALIQTLYPKEILTILKSIVKRDGLRKLEEQESNQIWRCLLLFLLLFLVVSPVFMYQTADYFGWKTAFLPYLSPYMQLMLIGAGLLGFKILVIAFIGVLFLMEQQSVQYVTGIIIMNALTAALLIPVSLGVQLSSPEYAHHILVGGLAFCGVFYLFSVANGVVTGLKYSPLSKFHLFLYFCTLEILPVLIIIKTVKTLI
ncbi:MAG: DUF4271 domain-containing protein [Bacteroidetes bacterium]|nr:DUF4271 domain-containing protein [Bacteroidota bacterium]